jgi:hypothetical protein
LFAKAPQRNCYLVNIQMNSLFPQRFQIDVFGDAVTICGFVFDFLDGDFQDHPVDGFIGEFICKGAVSERKKVRKRKLRRSYSSPARSKLGLSHLRKLANPS